MNSQACERDQRHLIPWDALYGPEAFSRLDDSDDRTFYERDRFVSHLDSLALSTVEDLIEQLIVEENPAILDLMAGWDSHIPEILHPLKVVGLGLNINELSNQKRTPSFFNWSISALGCPRSSTNM